MKRVSHFIVLEQRGDTLHDVMVLPPHIDRSDVFGVGPIKRAIFRLVIWLLA